MDKLRHDWLTEGLIDYEYKKYILLAYLKDISARFDRSELYPFMSDLIFHFRNLLKVRDSKQILYENFPKSLSEADFKKLKLTYKKIVEDDEVMKQIQDILAFAIPQMKGLLDEGQELYEFVEENLELEPIGLSPLYTDEGYLFINQKATAHVSIFRYQVTLFEHSKESYRSVATRFVSDEMRSISRTYESMKMDLARSYKDLPNPATFVATSKVSFPLNETVLPIAKRMLVKSLS